MRKLTLESLQVESFETTAESVSWRGTVEAHGAPAPDTPTCPPSAVSQCAPCESLEQTRCGHTCVYDCTAPCTIVCSNGCSLGIGCEICYLPGDTEAVNTCRLD